MVTEQTDNPEPRQYRKYSEDACQAFIDVFVEFGNVSAAAKAMHLNRATLYTWRKDHEDFAAAWDEAEAQVTDSLLAEGIRRARDGVTKPVYQSGEMVGEVQEYSDSLLKYMLQVRIPELRPNRQSLEVSNKDDKPFKTENVDLGSLTYDQILDLERTRAGLCGGDNIDPAEGNPEG